MPASARAVIRWSSPRACSRGSRGCAGAAYEITGHEAALVAEMFRRYADDGASIADLARWLTKSDPGRFRQPARAGIGHPCRP